MDFDKNFIFCHSVIIGAVRYYMGRHTIAADHLADDLASMVDTLPDKTRYVLKRDIEDWLKDHPTCEFGGVDDRKPWKNLYDKLDNLDNYVI